MPFFLSTVNPNSLVMMMLPGITLGQKPSVKASVSESVAGSTSQEAVLLVVDDVLEDPLDAAGNTVTAADAALGTESAYTPTLLPTAVNVYAVPPVNPVMVHDPDVPVTVHVLPSGDEVTRYDLGVSPPVGAVTVIVALPTPGSTVGALGALAATTLFRTEWGPNDAASAPAGV